MCLTLCWYSCSVCNEKMAPARMIRPDTPHSTTGAHELHDQMLRYLRSGWAQFWRCNIWLHVLHTSAQARVQEQTWEHMRTDYAGAAGHLQPGMAHSVEMHIRPLLVWQFRHQPLPGAGHRIFLHTMQFLTCFTSSSRSIETSDSMLVMGLFGPSGRRSFHHQSSGTQPAL